MADTGVTAEQLARELSKYLTQICSELNRNRDITIKRKAAGKIQLICESKKAIN